MTDESAIPDFTVGGWKKVDPELREELVQEQIVDNKPPRRRRVKDPDKVEPKTKQQPPASTVTRRLSLEDRIQATLVTVDLVLSLIPPLRDDVLTPEEIQMLAAALNHQAQQSPLFKKMLENALTVSSSGELVVVVAAIMIPRLARHKLLPEAVIDALSESGLAPEETTETIS